MTPMQAQAYARRHDVGTSLTQKIGLWPFTRYFLKLGTIGFGGPVALVGFMHRNLIGQQRRITEDTYKLSLALAQILPGRLAAQPIMVAASGIVGLILWPLVRLG